MATNYQRGADFERAVVRDFEAHGYAAIRSAGSHKPADVVALRVSETLVIQCKRDGILRPAEWNKFYCWAAMAGATPILASKGPRGHGIIYHRLTSRKDGKGRQPWEQWFPKREREQDGVSQPQC